MKVAFTGSSGAGKTTLVKYVSDTFGLPHYSGSAGDLKIPLDNQILETMVGERTDGHYGVIKDSALFPEYGILNQYLLQIRRHQLITTFDSFVTDRSPIDNFTYFVNQVGFHPQVNDQMVERFFNECVKTFTLLDKLIYIKPVQPESVEDNGSRIANLWYQHSIDAQFHFWLNKMKEVSRDDCPDILVIDYWDLDRRKKEVELFIGTDFRRGI